MNTTKTISYKPIKWLMFVIAVFVTNLATAENPQFLFFRDVIPTHSSITITGQGWELTIDSRYRVRFRGTHRLDNESATFTGQGILTFNEGRMQIRLMTSAQGSYSSSQSHFRYEQRTCQRTVRSNVAGGAMSGLYRALGGTSGASVQSHNPTYTARVYAGTTHRHASGSRTFNEIYTLTVLNDGRVQIGGRDMTLTMAGNVSRPAITRGPVGTHQMRKTAKTASQLNARRAVDEFGDWRWNSDRTRIYLQSAINDTNTLVILNNEGRLSLSLELVNGAHGISQRSISGGQTLHEMSLQADGGNSIALTFIEYTSSPQSRQKPPVPFAVVRGIINEGQSFEQIRALVRRYKFSNMELEMVADRRGLTEAQLRNLITENAKLLPDPNEGRNVVRLDHATYDRWEGGLQRGNSVSMLRQMRDMNMLVLSYKVNGQDQIEMFMLEGIDPLLERLIR